MVRVSHRGLTVWQKSMQLVVSVYELTRNFPQDELYGLTSQLRRATVSIPANIAEGNGRATRKEFARFLSIALASAREVDTLLELSAKVGIAKQQELQNCIDVLDEICRMLFRLRENLCKGELTQG